jgi:hypothetical protein
MSKTMKILLPILIVSAVAAIVVNVYLNFFAPEPKRGVITIEIPVPQGTPPPQESPTTK